MKKIYNVIKTKLFPRDDLPNMARDIYIKKIFRRIDKGLAIIIQKII